MVRLTQAQLVDVLTMEQIDINELRKPNGIKTYSDALFLLIAGDIISVNALAKLSWHTVATVKKVLDV